MSVLLGDSGASHELILASIDEYVPHVYTLIHRYILPFLTSQGVNDLINCISLPTLLSLRANYHKFAFTVSIINLPWRLTNLCFFLGAQP
jgi:hypothetical protein